MANKKTNNLKKQKRDIQILIMLAVVAFMFIVISFIFVLNSEEDKRTPVDPVNQNQEETGDNQTEDAPVSTDESVEPSDDESGREEASSDNKDEENKENKENQVVAEGAKTYVNEKTNVSYTIPESWNGLVQIHEKGNLVEFFYKDEDWFLALLTITHGDYKLNKEYYDSSYSVAHSGENGLVLYGLPNEHPLARKEGSDDYKELTAIMSDNYNLIKTIKTK